MKKLILSLSIVLGMSFAGFAQDNLKTAQQFIDYLIEEKTDELYDLFSEEAKATIQKAEFVEVVSQIKQQLGDPKTIHGATEVEETEGDANTSVVYYHVEYEMGDLDYKFVFDKDDNIQGFFIVPHEERGDVKKN